jgi:hypothetical protein
LNPPGCEKRFEARKGIHREVNSGLAPELIRYRIVAQRTDPEHLGASVVTNCAYGRAVEGAVAKARNALEKPDGLYGDQGMYRVVEVVEESPSSELRQQEEARRRYLTTILETATTTVRGREPDNPDAELLSSLDDFFTRAVTFPDPHTSGIHPRPHRATFGWTSEPPGIQHASDPGRALAPVPPGPPRPGPGGRPFAPVSCPKSARTSAGLRPVPRKGTRRRRNLSSVSWTSADSTTRP